MAVRSEQDPERILTDLEALTFLVSRIGVHLQDLVVVRVSRIEDIAVGSNSKCHHDRYSRTAWIHDDHRTAQYDGKHRGDPHHPPTGRLLPGFGSDILRIGWYFVAQADDHQTGQQNPSNEEHNNYQDRRHE
jgi:hypothetical protein